MTIKALPKAPSLTQRANISSDIAEEALARWNPAVRMGGAAGDNNVISVLDTIGEDFFGGGVTARRVSAALRSIGNKDVVVELNSPGGDYFEGLAIYNVLREHPKNVTVKILGLAASAAAVIAMAGDEILMPRAGFMMIHNTWVLAIGDQNALRETADFLAPFDAVAADIFAARTGIDQKKIKTMLDAETWIGGSDAVDQGFADDFLPADAVDAKAKNEFSGALLAFRRIENALAKGERMPRSERRRLLKELAATPSAGDDPGMPSAAETAVNDSDIARLHLEFARLKRLAS